jgi:hypothetical protein
VNVSRRGFSLGKPNQEVLVGKSFVRVCDEFGLALDPAEYADPKCRTCWGRGIFQRRVGTARTSPGAAAPTGVQISDTEEVVRCGCAARRYEKLRSSFSFGS